MLYQYSWHVKFGNNVSILNKANNSPESIELCNYIFMNETPVSHFESSFIRYPFINAYCVVCIEIDPLQPSNTMSLYIFVTIVFSNGL